MYMRNACFKALLLALAVTAWATLSNSAHAQQVTTLLDFNSTWKYNNSGTDLGTAWRAVGYNDGSWPSGPGLLGTETTPAIYAPFGTFQTPVPLSSIITYYFRTTFNFSGSPATPGLSLIASNLVDDGCAIFLNGTAVGTIRLAANATYTTAAADANPEATIAVLQIPASALRSGANTIAVEVHQSGATSSDMVFGMKLMAFTPQTLVITNQPDSQTVSVGDRVEFNVGVQGGPAAYRWQKDGVNLSSTSNTLVIASAQVANAGNYRVIVTNTLGSVTSSVATLTVTADTDGPQVVRAVIDNGFGSNSVNVLFNEVLNSTSARNLSNYRLVPNANTNISIQIANVLYSSALGALIQVSTNDANWNPRGDYFLVINRVADSKGNFIAPYTRVPVSVPITVNLTKIGDTWRFYDFNLFDGRGIFIYTNTVNPWYGENFTYDDNWGQGRGILYQDPSISFALCAGDTLGQQITFQPEPTLFRRTFAMPPGYGTNGQFRLRFIVDDGMVLYLNGKEVYRYNMPAGALTYLSKAVSQTPPTCITNVTIPVDGLKTGTNVLAAAVYQVTDNTESDTLFGLEMDGIFLDTPEMPIKEPAASQLKLTYNWNKTTRNLVMSWPTNFSGYTLVSKPAIGATAANPDWTQVKEQTNPYTNNVPTSGNLMFEIIKK